MLDLKIFVRKVEYDFLFKKNIGSEKRNTRIIHEIVNDENDSILTEISPLPGLHKETLIDATDKFLQYFQKIKTKTKHEYNFEPTTPLFNLLDDKDLMREFTALPPSSKYALELMALNLSGKLSEKADVEPSKLFMDGENYSNKNIKLKVREDEINKDKVILNDLLQNNNTIRIDGNNTFKAATMIELIDSCEKSKIEYIEDSFTSVQEELSFLKKFPEISLGRDLENISFKIEEHINFYILKPNLLGSISELFIKIREIEKAGKKVILSSCFEGDLGHRGLNYIYHSEHYKNKQQPGFDTKKYIKKRAS